MSNESVATVLCACACVQLLLALALVSLYVYSFLAHKEFRFVYPLLPWASIFSGLACASLVSQPDASSSSSSAASSGTTAAAGSGARRRSWTQALAARVGACRLSASSALLLYLLVTNVPLTVYTCVLHQRGTIQAIHSLRRRASNVLSITSLLLSFALSCLCAHVPMCLNITYWPLAMPCGKHSLLQYNSIHLHIYITCPVKKKTT